MIVAVVVTYTAHDELARCTCGLLGDPLIDRVVVVDNGGDVDLPDDDRLEIVRPGVNAGFAGGANIGFRRARELGAGLVVLLNDDVEIVGPWLPPILDALTDPAVGAVQPLLLDGDRGVVESAGVQLDRYGAGTDLWRGRPLADVESQAPTVMPIELFTGGAVVLRPELLAATAGFDERFFLYYEDVDLARRGAALGWDYRCVTAAQVVHRPGTSSSQLGDELVYLRDRNRLWSAVRNEPWPVVARGFGLSLRRLRWAPRRAHRRALLDGLTGTPRRLAERWRRTAPRRRA